MDTYSSANSDEANIAAASASSSDGPLVRLITCVYYLNEDWRPEHQGHIRVFVKPTAETVHTQQHWDIAPKLDTLVVFRSHDVEHEVLPTYHERMAITVWYYGHLPRKREVPSTASMTSTILLQQMLGPSKSPAPSSKTIFVAIPSYRDSECRHTVDDLLRQAEFPGRISIGICLQSEESDPLLEYLHKRYGNDTVRVHWVDYRKAEGPCVARALAQKLWRGEPYYLQIDSHMRFRKGWDTYLLDQLTKCPSDKPILTTYPPGYTLPNNVSVCH